MMVASSIGLRQQGGLRRVRLGEVGLASPYATGGGGTVLEHAYGATLLAALLQGHPVVGLGDDVTPREVCFQQGAVAPVDDLVVVGTCPTGSRSIYNGCVGRRRSPGGVRRSLPFWSTTYE
jgi:hypothetical protein